MFNGRFKHWMFKYYLWIIFILVLLGLLWFFLLSNRGSEHVNALLLFLGGVVAFFYFIHRQGLEELKIFNELFKDFNKRYDQMNSALNKIRQPDGQSPQDLDAESIHRLYDYFNLCGEEYLYFRKGYIYPEVWDAWRSGMRYFLEDGRIRELWEKEEKTGSYYGLTLAEIKR